MSRCLLVAPVLAASLMLGSLAGCGTAGAPALPRQASAAPAAVKLQAAARKETRAQAEARAKRYIAEFNETAWRSINARSEMVRKIARTDSDAAYDFLLQEIEDLQELRGEMKKVTAAEAEEYEELLTEELDEMTPDQQVVKARVRKAESLSMDLDEVTILEEQAAGPSAQWAGNARVGSRNRVLSAIQESKLYRAVSRAFKNTRKKVRTILRSLCRKVLWCR
ncbi:MAG: hypothetical protein VKP62_06980 [Candidatus Sericytochromatia bacterium]|nr:hypothetical protein [Candidatus Sericytochromatia bacterium]